MPVAPPISSYYSTRSSNFYRNSTTPSTSSLIGRNSSLDRSGYSSYNSSYGGYSAYSSYGSRYSSKPPRPSYSSSYSSDSYRSRHDSSPVRSSYSSVRNTSETRESEERTYSSRGMGNRSASDASSRYAASTIASRLRDSSSNSRDSGYGGSRLTSRDRSVDVRNGNSFDTKAYGPSAASYASNYRWEGRGKNKDKSSDNDTNEETTPQERVRVTDRIRNYETIDDDLPSPSSRYAADEVVARRKRDEDLISARRQRLGLSPIRKSRSRTPDHTSYSRRSARSPDHSSYVRRGARSPEQNGNNEQEERRQSVIELRRKYDTSNHNGYTSSYSKYDDESPTAKAAPTIRCDSPTTTTSSTRRRTDSGNYSRDSPISSRSANDSGNKSDSENRSSIKVGDSPASSRKALSSPHSRSPDGRKSPLSNGTSTKVSLLSSLSSALVYIHRHHINE